LLAVVAISVALVAVPLALKWAPQWLASTDGLTGGARAEEVGRTRTALLALLAGLVASVGAVYAARTFALNRRGHELNREGQITERFTRAIDQLGRDRAVEVRLGGIYALERVARESQRDHGPIIEILTAYVREHASLPPKAPTRDADGPATPTDSSEAMPIWRRPRIATDVQAALTVIARRNVEYEDEDIQLDLSFVDIHGANLPEARLERVRFQGANLDGANLESARLAGADFLDASLEHANLGAANLDAANLLDASLEHADLEEANLSSATLVGANLSYANLDLTELTGARMYQAVMKGANLRKTVFVGANVGEADFTGARVDRAVFFEAKYLDGTIWPSGVNPEAEGAIRDH
jgi:hypothetical protein